MVVWLAGGEVWVPGHGLGQDSTVGNWRLDAVFGCFIGFTEDELGFEIQRMVKEMMG